MKTTYSLSSLEWSLAGTTPFQWRFPLVSDIREFQGAEIPPVPARVPGSVQSALRDAAVIPDWNQGNNYRLCEWVENRHWIYQTRIPAGWVKPGAKLILNCLGLDDRGWVLVDGKEAGAFKGTFHPHTFDLTGLVSPAGARLQIIFDTPPRWLGQFGYTSRFTDWRPRYNYTWDWTARLVQIGIWDEISLEVIDSPVFDPLRADTSLEDDGSGEVRVWGRVSPPGAAQVNITLSGPGVDQAWALSAVEFNHHGWSSRGLAVHIWQPNGQGSQPLYDLTVSLSDPDGQCFETVQRRLGFKHIEWLACQDAPPEADPWICAVNGTPVFLQGFNWTPLRPNFADVTPDQYRAVLKQYQAMGCNILRVWGGAFLEKECFYNLCDELGLFVWQEFPLSSSGVENWPPDDLQSIAELSEIAHSYIARRQHHVSLLCWCGGNELQSGLDGAKEGVGRPVDLSHPLIARFAEIVRAEDPQRRFLPSSSSGPRFSADPQDFGKGLHWDVHGPWKPEGSLEEWADYWGKIDGLFHSEVGAPGASSADLIRSYSGGLPLTPGTYDNPLWRRTLWWIEWPEFVRELRREPASLGEFVDWSQERQARALEIVARSLKSKFPRCGGVIFWMGHDSYPVTANTAVIDYDGNLKPAAEAIARVFLDS
jgi:beta-mannosidase